MATIRSLFLLLLLTGCADRYLRSCVALIHILGPALLTLDCKPPDYNPPPEQGKP